MIITLPPLSQSVWYTYEMIRTLLLSAVAISSLIDARVKEYADAGLFSGVVLVAKGDAIVYQKAFGFADRTFNVPNTVDTRFQIASVSKPITAAAVLLLADRGKLSLTDPVSRFVPDFPNGDRITIEELVTHYSGLADASSLPEYTTTWSRLPQTPASLVAQLAKLPLRGEPGSRYSYSNSNYHLLALIIEKVSGMSYGDFLARNIFTPLGMSETGHHGDEKDVIPRLATGYAPKDADVIEKPAYLDWSSKTGNGSLYSTAGDLLKFQPGRLLKPETLKLSYGFDLKNRSVGYFWFHHVRNGHRSIFINGSSPGFKAHLERFIDDDTAVIVLSNLYIGAPTPMVNDISDLLWADNPKLEPVPKRVERSSADLDRDTGDYQFDKNYFVPNVVAHVERREGYLVMTYKSTGFVIPLVPTAGGYFDRIFWSTVRFENDKLIYRNGGVDYVGTKVTTSSTGTN